MASFYVRNFGCRATQADGAALEQDFLRRGLRPAAHSADADVVVLNTCTVTAAADQDARRAVRRIHRENPRARILVTGCYAQRAPQEVAALPGVRWVVGNSHKTRIGEILSEEAVEDASLVPLAALLQPAKILTGDILYHTTLLSLPVVASGSERTRPNLKIQDGCNNRCSFCIIPAVRGRSRSLAPEEAIGQVRGLADAGYREVVLSGINLGRYGRDFQPRLTLAQILRRMLGETAVERLRLSSVEPMDFTDELLELMASTPRFARHVHAPLQSGSARVLRAMRRRYRPEQYEERIRRAHALLPNAAFGADVMVGFPGETDQDFEATRSLVERLPFTYLHVFTYSRREGTPGASMPGQVHGRVAQERNRILRDLAARKNRAFRERQVGRTLSVLTLEDGSALSSNYLRVFLEGERRRPNELLSAHITGVTEDGLAGLG